MPDKIVSKGGARQGRKVPECGRREKRGSAEFSEVAARQVGGVHLAAAAAAASAAEDTLASRDRDRRQRQVVGADVTRALLRSQTARTSRPGRSNAVIRR